MIVILVFLPCLSSKQHSVLPSAGFGDRLSGTGIIPRMLFALASGGGRSASLLLPPLFAVTPVYFHLIKWDHLGACLLSTSAYGRMRIQVAHKHLLNF